MTMRKIDYDKRYYVNDDGTITDCFGDEINSIDEFAEEMDFLMQELRNAKRVISSLKIPSDNSVITVTESRISRVRNVCVAQSFCF